MQITEQSIAGESGDPGQEVRSEDVTLACHVMSLPLLPLSHQEMTRSSPPQQSGPNTDMVVRTELTTGTFDPRNYKVVLSKIQNFAQESSSRQTIYNGQHVKNTVQILKKYVRPIKHIDRPGLIYIIYIIIHYIHHYNNNLSGLTISLVPWQKDDPHWAKRRKSEWLAWPGIIKFTRERTVEVREEDIKEEERLNMNDEKKVKIKVEKTKAEHKREDIWPRRKRTDITELYHQRCGAMEHYKDLLILTNYSPLYTLIKVPNLFNNNDDKVVMSQNPKQPQEVPNK